MKVKITLTQLKGVAADSVDSEIAGGYGGIILVTPFKFFDSGL